MARGCSVTEVPACFDKSGTTTGPHDLYERWKTPEDDSKQSRLVSGLLRVLGH